MTDELDQVDITWNALNTAIEALDQMKAWIREEREE